MREEVEDALGKTQSVSEGLLNGAQYWGVWKYLDRVEVGLALGSIGDMLSSLCKILLAGKNKKLLVLWIRSRSFMFQPYKTS